MKNLTTENTMNNLTQKEILLNVLEDAKDFVPSYNLIKTNTKWGWLGSGADRQARDLAIEGLAQRKKIGRYTYYKLIENQQPSLI